MTGSQPTTKKLVWGFVVVLAILHYDFWLWDDRTLVFGFMPIGLLYQASISLAAGVCWALVVRFAWPTWIEEWASAGESGEDAEQPR